MEIIKKIFSFLGRFFGVLWGVVFALGGLGGLIAAFTEKQPAFYAMVVPMWALAALLLWVSLKKKKAAKSVSPPPVVIDVPVLADCGIRIETQLIPDVPEETLRQMRRYYTAMQAENDARILAESFQLCQQTTNFDTFSGRYELAQQKIFTLLQAHQAGCKGLPPYTVETCTKALAALHALKIDYLFRIYTKETNAALLLKTPAGQRRRLEAFIEGLQEKETFFMDVEVAYNKTIADTKALMP